MADEVMTLDPDRNAVDGAITDDANLEVRNLRMDDATKALIVEITF